MTGFPWSEVMRFGLGTLGMPARAFWAMTPRELAAAHAGRVGQGAIVPLGRNDLTALMARHPDGDRR